jgi:hypothetical protein
MTWQDGLKGDSLSWLLEAESPAVRHLALRDLLDRPPDDGELRAARQAAHAGGPIAAVLAQMHPEGYWAAPGPGYNPKYRSTVWALILLAQLGASAEQDSRIAAGCRYVLDHALTPDGHFTISGAPSGTIDCLQGNLCWAVLELGFQDARLTTAFDWLARSVTGEGVASADDRQAPRRYYAYKCGPDFACGANNKLPCAWGAAKVMLALGKWPARRRTALMKRAIRRGIDFLLGTDPADARYPSGFSDKPSGNWWKFGFPVFYVTDLLQIVEALGALGYGADPRLARAVSLVLEKQDAQGRWALEYDYTGKTWADFGPKKRPNKWVTLRALRALKLAAKAASS